MNLSREILSVSFFHDIPRAYIFEYHNETFLRGPYAETVNNFARYQNFILKFEVFDDVPGVYRIFSDIYLGKFNMSTYSTTFASPSTYIAYSYPIEKNKKCVMVPFSHEMPRYLYIVAPFGLHIWICLICGIFYIGVLMRFIALGNSSQRVARSVVRNIPHALNITLYTNNMGVNIKNAPIRMLVFYTLLYLYGFIISAYHLPYLTSFCMKPLFMKPIDTVQDILNVKMPIIVKATSFTELQYIQDIKWPMLMPLMVNVTGMRYQSLLREFNRNYAYIVALDQWDFISRQQQNLEKPIFHLTQVCFSAALRSLPIQANWSHTDALNIYLMRIQDSGHWQHWIDIAFIDAIANGDAKILLDSYQVAALKLDFFLIAWGVLAIGGASSFLVMISELLIWSYQRKRQKQKIKKQKLLNDRKKLVVHGYKN